MSNKDILFILKLSITLVINNKTIANRNHSTRKTVSWSFQKKKNHISQVVLVSFSFVYFFFSCEGHGCSFIFKKNVTKKNHKIKTSLSQV